MKEEVRKQLGKPKNDLEKDTLNYIEPLVTDMIGEDIIGKGLTLSGCLEYCFKNGKKFEIKNGNKGCARVTEEQHFAWVREYFGIEGAAELSNPKPVEEKPSKLLDMDFDDMFD